MTVAVDTDLSGVAGSGAGIAAGTFAGKDVGIGSGASIGRAIAGKESFKSSWQSMLSAWGGSARTVKETPEAAANESSEATTKSDTSSGQSAGSLREALAFAGPEAAQSTFAATRRTGSTASTSVPGNGAEAANQSLQATNGLSGTTTPRSAAPLSTTRAAGNSAISRPGSKNETRDNSTQNAGKQEQAQDANGGATAPIDGYTAPTAAPQQISTPPENATHSAATIFRGGFDDRAGGRAVITNQSAPGTTAAVNEAKGATSTIPAMTATNPNTSASQPGQIPIHAAQTPPGHHTNHSGPPAGLGRKHPDQDDEQDDFAKLPSTSLAARGIATVSVPGAAGAIQTETSPGIDEHHTAVGGFATHRGAAETGRALETPGSHATGSDELTVEPGTASTQPALAQTAHETASGGANPETSRQNAVHNAAAQYPGIETSAMVRDPAGAHGTTNAPTIIGSSTRGPAPGSQETFAALDAGTAVGAPNWVHAGGHQAEAGFEDPALGWVGVRAGLSAGSVHAAVVPGSAEAAQALSGHLAGLSAYLSEHQMPVATLTMSAPGNSGIEAGPDQSLGQGMGRGMDQNSGQHAEQNSAQAVEMGSRSGTGASASSSATSAAAPGSEFDTVAYARDGRGTHISVMA